MKKSEAIKQIRETEIKIELKRLEKLREMEAEMDLENRESNRNRARSITVGTAFGGTTEILMRSDGGRHIWCTMQPVEVIELINQLAANVGCNISIKPKDDFASWRDWRVSEAEKKHLNNHVPFVNDMAVFQKLGASGYNDDEARKILDIIANATNFANENNNEKILFRDKVNFGEAESGSLNLMILERDQLLCNKVIVNEGNVVYMAGGDGGAGGFTIQDGTKEVKNIL